MICQPPMLAPRSGVRWLTAGCAAALLVASPALVTDGVQAAGGASAALTSSAQSTFPAAPTYSWPERTPSTGEAQTRTVNGGADAADGAYTALAPTRLLDTQVTHHTLGTGGELSLTVTGENSVPTDATAVALNVTVTDTTEASFLTVFPAGEPLPVASNLNWTPGVTVPDLVIVPVGTGGQVTFYNAQGSVDVVVDLEGYFAPAGSETTAGSYVPLNPARIADTRTGSDEPYAGETLRAQSSLDIQVTGEGGIPTTGVAAALLNVTVTDTTMPSYLTVYPESSAVPVASNLNWTAGETIPNRVVVPVSPGGQISVYNDQGDAQVVIDVNGYFTNGSSTPVGASLFGILNPVRVLDTRVSSQTLGPAETITQAIAGADGVASNASAIVSSITVTNTSAASFFTVFPGGARPVASDLNWVAGQTIPNLTVATLSDTGTVSVYNDAGSADLVIDGFGYFVPESPAPVVILSTSLPSTSVGDIGYSATLSGYGGTIPYSWSLATGSLPPGLTLSSTGVISGEPTSASGSPYQFSVDLTDDSPTPETATQSLSLSVDPAPSEEMLTSGNWSGYALAGGPYTEVTGTFVVPELNSAHEPAGYCMSEWVGIDGFANKNLIQAGILECSLGGVYYGGEAWWEILPADATTITTLTDLTPGDHVTVTIGQVTGTAWAITVTDDTQGQSFSTVQKYTGPATSADWIVEAPVVNGSEVYLMDYTETEFSELGALGASSGLAQLVMKQDDAQVSTPSALDATGFNLAYGSTAPSPP